MYYGLQSMFYKAIKGYQPWSQLVKQTQTKQLEVMCCRRDSTAVQCVVASQEPFLLTTHTDPLFWKGGPLPIVRVEVDIDEPLTVDVRLIGFVEDDDRTQKADVLLDAPELFVEARTLQPVWIECTASADTPSGSYMGTVRLYSHTMFEDEQLLGVCTFVLNVKEAVLPEPQHYSFYLDLWQHNANIARKSGTTLWSEDHFAVLDAYLASMGRLGQKALSVVVSEIPWSGQFSHRDREPSNLFEYSIIGVTRDRSGTFHYDYTALNRYVALGETHGIRAEIELFGLLNIWQDIDAGYGAIVEGYPDGIRVRYYDAATGTYRFMRQQEQLEHYIRALEAHLASHGWIDRVRVLADEPGDVPLFQKRLERLRHIAPAFRYKIAIHSTSIMEQLTSEVNDYVPVLSSIGAAREKLVRHQAKPGSRTLYYLACNPDIPNTFLRSPALESRLIPWLVEKLGLDGFLRWNYTAWVDDPLRKLSYRSPIWKAGDANFVYPGAAGKPQLSLRYKWLQRGIRDYELMQLLKAAGRGSDVRQAVDHVLVFTDPCELDPDARKRSTELYRLTEDAYDALLRLV
ncbi:DUF4091 domain-containing protein [Paenibacillus sp. GCM10012303]|uniref:DUF4091 domain-containing protein n=1 Tax=Paenibacillus sp. GCM10012303 TaxID=3317340 RepID=UPI0036D3106A